MAEIKIGNAKYVTLDDKTASAESINSSETTFQKTVKIEEKEYTVTRLGYACEVKNIPDSVTSIRSMWRCSNISIPDSVTSMGYMENCSNITIPDSVTFIGNLVSCSNISIPDSITMLNGIYRSTLTIPASVTTIKGIDGENGTLFLRMESAIPPALANATNLAKDDMLTVPEGATEAYKKHPVWGKFKNISEDPRLNKDSAPASKGNAGSNKEISELKKELNELRKDIANLMKLHKELREDFEELKKKD